MVSKTVLCKVGSVALFLVGAGLFIFGFLVIGTVDDLLKDGVKKSLKLESGDIDEKFINSTNVKYSAYVYNISNWDQFVAGSALPTFNLLGPYEYQEYAVKYNMSFSPDGTTFKYNEFWTYEPLTPRATTDVVYTANLVFGGVLGGFFQTLASPPTSAAVANATRPDSLLDEPKLLGHVLMPQVHPVAADQFSRRTLIPVAAANTFRSFLPATVFGSYVDGLKATLTAGACPAAAIRTDTDVNFYNDIGVQWANKTFFNNEGLGLWNCSSSLAGFKGFELDIALPPFLGQLLFNDTSFAASLRSTAGQQAWAAAIAGDTGAVALLNASFPGGAYSVIRASLNALWFNSLTYENTAIGVISQGLTSGLIAGTGRFTAPELLAANSSNAMTSTDFSDASVPTSIYTNYKNLFSGSSLGLPVSVAGAGFDKLAALQFSTGVLTAKGGSSTFLTASLKGLFGLNGTGINAVQLDGLEYARYLGKTVVDLYNAGGSFRALVNASAPDCAGFLAVEHALNVTRYLGCVYMYNAPTVVQAQALMNKTQISASGIVGWAVRRLNGGFTTATRAAFVNGLLGLSGGDVIAEEKIALLGDYFLYRLPLAVFKGRMYLNANSNPNPLTRTADYRVGGLFRKLTPNEVFQGYFDQFVPATVAPGFFGSTLATFTNQEAAFASAPYSPHELYTGTSDIQKARWWKSYRGVSNLTLWEDTYVEDITVSEATGRATRAAEANRTLPRDGGKVWKTSEIIDGTSDGKTAGPFQEDNQVEERNNLYVSQARRSARLLKSGEVVTFKGIKLVRYRFNVKTVQNATLNPDNDKYYMDDLFQTSQFSCPSGLVPLQRMARGAPVFLSQAGFYNVDGSVIAPYTFTQSLFDSDSAVFDPTDRDRWDTYLDMEPFSGATMNAHKRLQVNLWLPKTWFVPQPTGQIMNGGITGYGPGVPSQVHATFFNQVADDVGSVPSKKSNLFIPISIYDETGQIKDDDAKEFRQKIYDNRDLADNLRIIFIVVGAFFMIVALGCLYHFSRKTGMDRLESKADLTN